MTPAARQRVLKAAQEHRETDERRGGRRAQGKGKGVERLESTLRERRILCDSHPHRTWLVRRRPPPLEMSAPPSTAAAAKRKRGSTSTAEPAPPAEATRAPSSRSAAKNYLSTLFNKAETAAGEGEAAAAASPSAAASSSSSAAEPAAKKKKVAASKAQKANEAAAPAAAAAAVGAKGKGKGKTSTAASSAASSSSSPAAPVSSTPSYPATPDHTSFVFDASLPLAQGTTQLLRAILNEEQARIDATYGSGKRAGKYQHIADACRDVGQGFLAGVEAAVSAALAADGAASGSAEGSAPVLEHPANTAARESLAKWATVSAQTRSELDAWRSIVAQLEDDAANARAAAGVNASQPPSLSAEDESFLAAHDAGRLTTRVSQAVASARVKGDASLHALEQLQGYLAGVAADQRTISARINAEEKKAYGAAVDDPRQLIAMMTEGQ